MSEIMKKYKVKLKKKNVIGNLTELKIIVYMIHVR